jgi:hypothetical protein
VQFGGRYLLLTQSRPWFCFERTAHCPAHRDKRTSEAL